MGSRPLISTSATARRRLNGLGRRPICRAMKSTTATSGGRSAPVSRSGFSPGTAAARPSRASSMRRSSWWLASARSSAAIRLDAIARASTASASRRVAAVELTMVAPVSAAAPVPSSPSPASAAGGASHSCTSVPGRPTAMICAPATSAPATTPGAVTVASGSRRPGPSAERGTTKTNAAPVTTWIVRPSPRTSTSVASSTRRPGAVMPSPACGRARRPRSGPHGGHVRPPGHDRAR